MVTLTNIAKHTATLANSVKNSATVSNIVGAVTGFFVSDNTDYYMVGSAEDQFLVFSDTPQLININNS